MTHPGLKFGGDRWLTPQMHEYVFRAEATFAGAVVRDDTLLSVTSGAGTTATLPGFVVPADVQNAQLIVCVSGQTAGGLDATVASVTWNTHTLTELIEGVNASHNTASIHRWLIVADDLGDTSDIVVTYDAAVTAGLVCAYVITNVSTDVIDDDGVATVANSATVSIPLTTTVDDDLVLDWFTHVYSGLGPSPVTAGTTGQTAVSGILDNSVDLLGASSKLAVPTAGAISMGWSGLDPSSSNTVQVALALKPFIFVPPTQPVTAKLALGYDFSGMDSTITVTGTGISNVTDSSGNANTGVQTTDSRRLLYGTATINGLLAADGVGNVNANVTLPATITNYAANGQPPFHFLLVFVAGTWATANLFTFQNNGSAPRAGFRLSTSGGNRVEARVPNATPGSTTILSNQTTLTTGTTYLAELYVDGGGVASLIVNEGTAVTNTSASSGESLTRRFVADFGGGGNVKYGAAYIFNDKLTAGELAEWRTFLKYRWGYTV